MNNNFLCDNMFCVVAVLEGNCCWAAMTEEKLIKCLKLHCSYCYITSTWLILLKPKVHHQITQILTQIGLLTQGDAQ